MMKFFQDNKPRLVWDPAKNRVTATFQDGNLETDNQAVADLLIRNGYRFDGVLSDPGHIPDPVPAKESEKKEEPKRAKPKRKKK